MEKQHKKLLNLCAWSAIVLFVVRCVISLKSIIAGTSFYEILGYASEAISVAIIFVGIYEKLLWRINPFEKTPKLAKQYTGVLKSNYDQAEREATMEIKQSLLSVRVILSTKESKSLSLSASVDDILGEIKLTYCYLNTPKAEYRNKSEIHYGTATLSITNSGNLEGQYYTDRATRGDMVFTKK